jgi:hypothetical protein
VQLVDTHGAETIISAVARLSAEHEARVIVSTVHKAKGREWPGVRIGPGFEPPADKDGEPRPVTHITVPRPAPAGRSHGYVGWRSFKACHQDRFSSYHCTVALSPSRKGTCGTYPIARKAESSME